jgi:hypothetical protein
MSNNLQTLKKSDLRDGQQIDINVLHPTLKDPHNPRKPLNIGGAHLTVREDRRGQPYLYLGLLKIDPPKWQGRGAVKRLLAPLLGFADKNNLVIRGGASPLNRDIRWAPAHLTPEEKMKWQSNAFKDLVAMYKSMGGQQIHGGGRGSLERLPHPERFGSVEPQARLSMRYYDFIRDYENLDDRIEIDINNPENLMVIGDEVFYYDEVEEQSYQIHFESTPDMAGMNYVGNIFTKDNKDEELKWITMKGRKVPIRPGQTVKEAVKQYTDPKAFAMAKAEKKGKAEIPLTKAQEKEKKEREKKAKHQVKQPKTVAQWRERARALKQALEHCRKSGGDFNTLDNIKIENFKKIEQDFQTTDFTVYHGPITREGPFRYYKNGKWVTLYKDYDNLVENFNGKEFLPLKAVVGNGSHHAKIHGFTTNWEYEDKPKPGNKYRMVNADIVLLNDIYGHPEAVDLNKYHVSIGFEDEIEGIKQIIKNLDHLAMSDTEVGRCSTAGGDDCTVQKISGSKS